MKILAIETSTDACSIALLIDNSITERFAVVPQAHTLHLLPMCSSVLSDAGTTLSALDGIAFSRGPGAFTGVRIAAAAAQGLALGVDIPVIPVSSLAALAFGVAQTTQHEYVAAALDARMQEVYWACYRIDLTKHLVHELTTECVCPPSNVPIPHITQSLIGVGPGWQSYGPTLKSRFANRVVQIDAHALPKARDVARLAMHINGHDPMLAAPVYLRDNVAHQSSKR